MLPLLLQQDNHFLKLWKNNETFFFSNDLEGKEKVYECYFEFILLPELRYCNTGRSHRHTATEHNDRFVDCQQSYSTNNFSIIKIFSWFEGSVSIPRVHTTKNTNDTLWVEFRQLLLLPSRTEISTDFNINRMRTFLCVSSKADTSVSISSEYMLLMSQRRWTDKSNRWKYIIIYPISIIKCKKLQRLYVLP